MTFLVFGDSLTESDGQSHSRCVGGFASVLYEALASECNVLLYQIVRSDDLM